MRRWQRSSPPGPIPRASAAGSVRARCQRRGEADGASAGRRLCHRHAHHEIRPPERLVFTWAWDGEDGKPGHETLATITFRVVGQEGSPATEMTFHHQRFADGAARDRHQGGWIGSFDKLAEFLAKR